MNSGSLAIKIRSLGIGGVAANDSELGGRGGSATTPNALMRQVDHSILAFTALMSLAARAGLDAGWSRYDSEGSLHFGGGWVIGWITAPSGLLVRRHIEQSANLNPDLERSCCSVLSEQDQSLQALAELSLCSFADW